MALLLVLLPNSSMKAEFPAFLAWAVTGLSTLGAVLICTEKLFGQTTVMGSGREARLKDMGCDGGGQNHSPRRSDGKIYALRQG